MVYAAKNAAKQEKYFCANEKRDDVCGMRENSQSEVCSSIYVH
jgi:hypothetical protein